MLNKKLLQILCMIVLLFPMAAWSLGNEGQLSAADEDGGEVQRLENEIEELKYKFSVIEAGFQGMQSALRGLSAEVSGRDYVYFDGPVRCTYFPRRNQAVHYHLGSYHDGAICVLVNSNSGGLRAAWAPVGPSQ